LCESGLTLYAVKVRGQACELAVQGNAQDLDSCGGAMEIPEQLIAKRIRELRESRQHTLEQVATRAGISKSFLSKVERCNVSISIAALSRLAGAFNVSIGEFFDSDEPDSEVIYVPRGESRSVTGTIGTCRMTTTC